MGQGIQGNHNRGRNRADIDQMTELEKWITSTMQAVENCPADPRLTKCVTLLADARDVFADWWEDVPMAEPVPVHREQPVPKGLRGLTLNGTHFITADITGSIEPDTLFYADLIIGGNVYFVRYDGVGNLCIPAPTEGSGIRDKVAAEMIKNHPDPMGLNLFSRFASTWRSVLPLTDNYPMKELVTTALTSRIASSLDGARGQVQQLIAEEGLKVVDTLLRKNKDYGSSVFEPPELDQTISPEVGLLCRLSDKVRRIRQLRSADNQAEVAESLNDSVGDMSGYSILLLVWNRLKDIAKGKGHVSVQGNSGVGCSSDPGVPGSQQTAGQLSAEETQHQQPRAEDEHSA